MSMGMALLSGRSVEIFNVQTSFGLMKETQVMEQLSTFENDFFNCA